ncbi:MAG: 50S ribosomal protein L10 [Erysipelotrichaceae bacterium]|nr:50S ribosomal protein L10 [Erysipelotrichaceae bacterium]
MSKEILEAKQQVIDEISENLKSSQSTIVAEYRGLNVAEMTELRRALRAENVGFKIYKNKLVQRALDEANMSELDAYLKGPNALAFGHEDAVAPARVLADFAKKHPNLQIKAGYVEGKFLPQEDVMAVAKLPNRDGMYSMLLACLKEPVAKVARAVKAVADAKEEGKIPETIEVATEEVVSEAVESAAE